VRTHPVDKLLEQHCYKSAAGLLQLVRFSCVISSTLTQILFSFHQGRRVEKTHMQTLASQLLSLFDREWGLTFSTESTYKIRWWKSNSSDHILQWVIVRASAAISWLCCVWRSLSFFFKIDKPDNTIFSGRSEPQLYIDTEKCIKMATWPTCYSNVCSSYSSGRKWSIELSSLSLSSYVSC
jgi:hypothetical protein